MEFDADIVIAGAGPSGLMVGCETTLGGVSTIILEKRDGPALTRAGTLAPRVLEIFASRGIVDAVMERAFELHPDPRTPEGIWAGLSSIHYGALDTDYPYILMFPQIETERLLADRFRQLGGEIRLKSQVTGFDQDPEGVTVHYLDDNGAAHSLRAHYLVGCDGGRSTVREAAGIEFSGRPAGRIAVNVDALADNPYPQNLTVSNDVNGWAMTYPLRKGLTRFAMIDAATYHQVPEKPLTIEEAKCMLRRVHGSDFGIKEVNAISTFHDALFMARDLRQGRVFLVGEAVRLHYPASGVGMQFCLQDAFNLGWKLAYVVRGDALACLLDTFETERLPEIDRLLDSVRTQCALQFNFDEEHVALKRRVETDFLRVPEVNRRIAEELAGLSAAYPAQRDDHPCVGRRFPDLKLGGGSEANSVFELLRTQKFAVLDLTAASRLPALDDQMPLAAASLATPAPIEFEGVATVLLRPDGHVAWAGDKPLSEGLPADELEKWLPRHTREAIPS